MNSQINHTLTLYRSKQLIQILKESAHFDFKYLTRKKYLQLLSPSLDQYDPRLIHYKSFIDNIFLGYQEIKYFVNIQPLALKISSYPQQSFLAILGKIGYKAVISNQQWDIFNISLQQKQYPIIKNLKIEKDNFCVNCTILSDKIIQTLNKRQVDKEIQKKFRNVMIKLHINNKVQRLKAKGRRVISLYKKISVFPNTVIELNSKIRQLQFITSKLNSKYQQDVYQAIPIFNAFVSTLQPSLDYLLDQIIYTNATQQPNQWNICYSIRNCFLPYHPKNNVLIKILNSGGPIKSQMIRFQSKNANFKVTNKKYQILCTKILKKECQQFQTIVYMPSIYTFSYLYFQNSKNNPQMPINKNFYNFSAFSFQIYRSIISLDMQTQKLSFILKRNSIILKCDDYFTISQGSGVVILIANCQTIVFKFILKKDQLQLQFEVITHNQQNINLVIKPSFNIITATSDSLGYLSVLRNKTNWESFLPHAFVILKSQKKTIAIKYDFARLSGIQSNALEIQIVTNYQKYRNIHQFTLITRNFEANARQYQLQQQQVIAISQRFYNNSVKTKFKINHEKIDKLNEFTSMDKVLYSFVQNQQMIYMQLHNLGLTPVSARLVNDNEELLPILQFTGYNIFNVKRIEQYAIGGLLSMIEYNQRLINIEQIASTQISFETDLTLKPNQIRSFKIKVIQGNKKCSFSNNKITSFDKKFNRQITQLKIKEKQKSQKVGQQWNNMGGRIKILQKLL